MTTTRRARATRATAVALFACAVVAPGACDARATTRGTRASVGLRREERGGAMARDGDAVTTLPGYGAPPSTQYSGFLDASASTPTHREIQNTASTAARRIPAASSPRRRRAPSLLRALRAVIRRSRASLASSRARRTPPARRPRTRRAPPPSRASRARVASSSCRPKTRSDAMRRRVRRRRANRRARANARARTHLPFFVFLFFVHLL